MTRRPSKRTWIGTGKQGLSPAASAALMRLFAGETLHIGNGPRGRSVRVSTAKELTDGFYADWTDYDNRHDRPGFETVSDARLYLPSCDGCRRKFSPRNLSRYEDLSLCVDCTKKYGPDGTEDARRKE